MFRFAIRLECSPPIGLKSIQNSTYLVLLRPIFAPKMKTLPPTGLGSRRFKKLLLFGPEKWSFFSGAHTKLIRSDWILVKAFFFWRSPDFDRKTASIWFKTDENLGQVRLLLFLPLKKASQKKGLYWNWNGFSVQIQVISQKKKKKRSRLKPSFCA